MAFNGSGTFVRVHDWTDDKANSIPVTASRTDAEDDGFATGLSTCITKDGQTTISADLPMGGFNHTGVKNSDARNEYLATGQYQDQGVIYATSTGSANAYVLTLSPAITSYVAGQRFQFKANFANTGATTLNVSTVGAQSIVKNVTDTLAAGDIPNNGIVAVVYDGTNFQIESVIATQTADVAIQNKTSAYTLTQSDSGTVVYMESASAITLTIPQNSTEDLNDGFNVLVIAQGAGTVTIAPEGTDNINGSNTSVDIDSQFQSAIIIKETDAEYSVIGRIV